MHIHFHRKEKLTLCRRTIVGCLETDDLENEDLQPRKGLCRATRLRHGSHSNVVLISEMYFRGYQHAH